MLYTYENSLVDFEFHPVDNGSRRYAEYSCRVATPLVCVATLFLQFFLFGTAWFNEYVLNYPPIQIKSVDNGCVKTLKFLVASLRRRFACLLQSFYTFLLFGLRGSINLSCIVHLL